ncbi:MAG: hypothetical protein PHU04_05375 [Candidatus Peribacteraceae bacterium]|nr:hypothetical protein [Candidatus Peribacteraceae bacterium]
MDDFLSTIAQQGKTPLSEKKQKQAGAPLQGALSNEHKQFLQTIKQLIASGEINVEEPKTFLKKDVYDGLSEEWKEKSDLALSNIAMLLKQMYELYVRTDTPNESPQYRTMIEQLWEMKQRIEEHHDVFKF